MRCLLERRCATSDTESRRVDPMQRYRSSTMSPPENLITVCRIKFPNNNNNNNNNSSNTIPQVPRCRARSPARTDGRSLELNFPTTTTTIKFPKYRGELQERKKKSSLQIQCTHDRSAWNSQQRPSLQFNASSQNYAKKMTTSKCTYKQSKHIPIV